MYKNWIYYIFIIFISGCIEIENPSDIPEITYTAHKAYYCIDELENENKCIRLSFHLKDGDGNIGLRQLDTINPFTGIYAHNFYFDMYIHKNDGFELWNDLQINYFDIPYIVPQGQNKTLIADVNIDMSFPVSRLTYDTLLLHFYIYDRAQNQSNTEISDTIIFTNENTVQ